jgi:hypothetical protein
MLAKEAKYMIYKCDKCDNEQYAKIYLDGGYEVNLCCEHLYAHLSLIGPGELAKTVMAGTVLGGLVGLIGGLGAKRKRKRKK